MKNKGLVIVDIVLIIISLIFGACFCSDILKQGGLVIFVKNAKAGRKNVKIKIIPVGSRHAKAEVVAESA